MTARSLNRFARATVALLALLAISCTIAACGGSRGSATTLLNETFDAHEQIQSGKIDLDLTLSGTGSASLRKPVALKLSGPFEEAGPRRLPRFDLDVHIETGGRTLTAGAISDDGALYVTLEGTAFSVPKVAVHALEKSFAEASKGPSGSSTFSALGIEPRRWLTHPVVAGEPTIGGVKTTKIEGGLDLKALLHDTSKLSGEAGSTGLSGAAGLSPQLITGLGEAVRSAKVAVYTGNSDHLLRRLTVDAQIAPKGEARVALGGLKTATLRLDLSLEDLGTHQTIVAPKQARPLSQLLEVLEGTGLIGPRS